MYRVFAILAAIALSALATAAFAQESPPCNESRGPVCIAPTEAVAAYLDAEQPFSTDPKACTKQCKAVVNACLAIAESHAKCGDGTTKGDRNIALANCAMIDDAAARKTCIVEARVAAKAASAALVTNHSDASAVCVDSGDDCVAVCGE